MKHGLILMVTFLLRTIDTGLPKIPILIMKFLTMMQKLGFGAQEVRVELSVPYFTTQQLIQKFI